MAPPAEGSYTAPADINGQTYVSEQQKKSPVVPSPANINTSLGKQPDPHSKPPAPREDLLGDKIFSTILAGSR